jgi:hypothetical protein
LSINLLSGSGQVSYPNPLEFPVESFPSSYNIVATQCPNGFGTFHLYILIPAMLLFLLNEWETLIRIQECSCFALVPQPLLRHFSWPIVSWEVWMYCKLVYSYLIFMRLGIETCATKRLYSLPK